MRPGPEPSLVAIPCSDKNADAASMSFTSKATECIRSPWRSKNSPMGPLPTAPMNSMT